jgi:Predicted integral membrane protein (DUF2189)
MGEMTRAAGDRAIVRNAPFILASRNTCRSVFAVAALSLRRIRHELRERGHQQRPVPISSRCASDQLGGSSGSAGEGHRRFRGDAQPRVIYPLLAFFSARLSFQLRIFHLFFPLASGVALVGPLATLGFYEISRRRELGLDASWTHAVAVLRSRSIFSVAAIGVALMAIFIGWLYAARAIYEAICGDTLPASIGQFFHEVFATPAGWTLVVLGNGVGVLFAPVALTISVVSFPLVLDRGVDAATSHDPARSLRSHEVSSCPFFATLASNPPLAPPPSSSPKSRRLRGGRRTPTWPQPDCCGDREKVDLMWRTDLLGLVFVTDLLVFVALCRDEFRNWRRVAETRCDGAFAEQVVATDDKTDSQWQPRFGQALGPALAEGNASDPVRKARRPERDRSSGAIGNVAVGRQGIRAPQFESVVALREKERALMKTMNS